MKWLLLMFSLVSSVNLVCQHEEKWVNSGPTYRDILASYGMARLQQEKVKIENELSSCGDSKKNRELEDKLRSVEAAIKCEEKAEEQELASYRKEVEELSLRDLESVRYMYKKSLQVDPKYIDKIREETNTKIKKFLVIVESEIEKRKKAQ